MEYVTGNQRRKDLDFSLPNQPFLIMFDGGHICRTCHHESAEEQAKDRSLGIAKPLAEYLCARKVRFDKFRKDSSKALKKYVRVLS
jgi:hypothetical protein